MVIGIDARLYGTKHAGIGRYIKELILNLLKIDHKNRYVFFIYKPRDKQIILKDVRQFTYILKLSDKHLPIKFVLVPYRWYSLSEQLLMARIIKKHKIDLMHFPHFNVPLFYNDPYIVTIHDLIIHHFPSERGERATTLPRWLYCFKLLGYKRVIKHAITSARAIITPSEFVKKDILEFYNVDDEKIRVIYEGVALLPEKVPNLSKVRNLNNYLLYVGSAYPHKNLEKLIDAFVILRQKYKFKGKLVLAGKIDYFYNQLQKYIISQYPPPARKRAGNIPISNIIFYGHANDCELAQLYSNATLFVFPSLSEGFGLPPLEAMSFGTPVVASNLTSIPEICGNAALYFNPNDVRDIAAKIHSVIASDLSAEALAKAEAKQSQLRQKGFAQIKKYSWAKMAQESLLVYQSVVLKSGAKD